MYNSVSCNIDVLLGDTLIDIHVDKHEIIFKTLQGTKYIMHHEQDCCESVTIESIAGDMEDLLGSPITMAEESGRSGSDKENSPNRRIYCDESTTWTFYKLATVKGYVTIRWIGHSNGYYSESVNFDQIVN